MFRACWHSLCACLLSLLSGVGASYAQGVITTVAGTDWVFPKTSVPALTASLGQVRGIAVDIGGNVFLTDQDNSGNLYIADTGHNRIRKVSAAGIITTLAGTGISGFAGDGGPASSAFLFLPESVAVDTAGNVYIADTGNNRVRKITPAGVIDTVAGGGSRTGDGGPATSASVSPLGMAVDAAGNLFICAGNIRKVTPDGTISTVAGNGRTAFSGDGGDPTAASLNGPLGVAVDGTGRLFIADTGITVFAWSASMRFRKDRWSPR